MLEKKLTKRKVAIFGGILAVAVTMVLTAGTGMASSGNHACFDWSCDTSNNGVCTFDASCSEINQGFIWRYIWTWGDGGQNLYSGPTATHTYSGLAEVDVTLELPNFSGPDADVTCTVRILHQIGPPGDFQSGRCE